MATRRPNPVAAAAARRARRADANRRATNFARKIETGRVGPGTGTNIRTGGEG